jgi:para-nitrobenzyl esterase
MAEIPLAFASSYRIPIYNETGARKLEKQMSTAWAAFAHTGNPNNSEIPYWPKYEKGNEATMVFDRECTVRINYDSDLIRMRHKSAPPHVKTPRANRVY